MTESGRQVLLVRSWSGTHARIGSLVGRYLAAESPARASQLRARWADAVAPARIRSTTDKAAGVARCLEAWWPPLLEELYGLARELDVPAAPVLASWAPPEIAPGGGSSCTLFWVPPRLTASGRPLAGRNFDLRLDRPERLLVYTQPSRGFSHVGTAGWCGRSEGINEAGLAVGTAEAQLKSGPQWAERPQNNALVALPARLVVRIVLERCATVDEAVELIRGITQWTTFNYLLADAAGNAAAVEVGVGKTSVRRPPGQEAAVPEPAPAPWLVATNHFVSAELSPQADYRWLTRQKYAATCAALEDARGRGPISPEDCQRVLAAPGVNQRRLTLWSAVFEPGGPSFWFAPGRPDRNQFREMPVAGMPPPDGTEFEVVE